MKKLFVILLSVMLFVEARGNTPARARITRTEPSMSSADLYIEGTHNTEEFLFAYLNRGAWHINTYSYKRASKRSMAVLSCATN